MKIIVFVFLCLGLLFYLVMVAAMVFKPKWVNLFFFLAILSEGAALMVLAVLEFLNL